MPGAPASIDQSGGPTTDADTDGASGDDDFDPGDELEAAGDEGNGDWSSAEGSDNAEPRPAAGDGAEASAPAPAAGDAEGSVDRGHHQDVPPGTMPDPDKQ